MNDDNHTDRVPLEESQKQEELTEAAKPEIVEDNREDGTSYMDDLEYHRVADFFELEYTERSDQHIAQRLSFLYDWAESVSKSPDRLTKLETIKDLTRKLGLQVKGKELILKLYQYTRLDQDKRRIERQMELVK